MILRISRYFSEGDVFELYGPEDREFSKKKVYKDRYKGTLADLMKSRKGGGGKSSKAAAIVEEAVQAAAPDPAPKTVKVPRGTANPFAAAQNGQSVSVDPRSRVVFRQGSPQKALPAPVTSTPAPSNTTTTLVPSRKSAAPFRLTVSPTYAGTAPTQNVPNFEGPLPTFSNKYKEAKAKYVAGLLGNSGSGGSGSAIVPSTQSPVSSALSRVASKSAPIEDLVRLPDGSYATKASSGSILSSGSKIIQGRVTKGPDVAKAAGKAALPTLHLDAKVTKVVPKKAYTSPTVDASRVKSVAGKVLRTTPSAAPKVSATRIATPKVSSKVSTPAVSASGAAKRSGLGKDLLLAGGAALGAYGLYKGYQYLKRRRVRPEDE